jgi:hypothetical protein
MAHACNPATWETEIRRIMASQGKKCLHDSISAKKPKLGMVEHACHPSDKEKHKMGGLWSRKPPSPK